MTEDLNNAASNEVVGVPSLDERSAMAFANDDAPDANSPAPTESTPSETPSPAITDADKARAERRAALAKLQAAEREKVDAQRALKERDELKAKLAALESSKPKEVIDPSSLDEEGFFKLAERLNITPTKLGEWLRERIANPELAAAHAAAKAIDPRVEELRKQNEELRARLDAFEQSQSQIASQAEEQRAVAEFVEFTKSAADAAPLSARFLDLRGAEEYHKLALSVVQNLPPGAGAQAILDEIEETLGQFRDVYQQKTLAKPPTVAAAAQAKTISNSLAQQRGTIVDESEDWAKLPLDERSARLFR